MSQRNVERIIGQLVTDESSRHRFVKDPDAALRLFAESGLDLTPGEFQALASIDPRHLFIFSNAIDSRLQRIDPQGGAQ